MPHSKSAKARKRGESLLLHPTCHFIYFAQSQWCHTKTLPKHRVHSSHSSPVRAQTSCCLASEEILQDDVYLLDVFILRAMGYKGPWNLIPLKAQSSAHFNFLEWSGFSSLCTLVNVWSGSKPFIKVVLKPIPNTNSCLRTTFINFFVD